MPRAGLFLAFEEHFQIHAGRHLRRLHRIERRENRLNRTFVVAGGAGIDARLSINAASAGRDRNRCAAELHLFGAQNRRPGRRGPFRCVDGLAVVVRVQHQSLRRAGLHQFAVDSWRDSRNGEELRVGEATRVEHADQMIGIAADIHRIGGEVRQRKEFRELGENRAFMLLAVDARSLTRGGASHVGLCLQARPASDCGREHENRSQRGGTFSHRSGRGVTQSRVISAWRACRKSRRSEGAPVCPSQTAASR